MPSDILMISNAVCMHKNSKMNQFDYTYEPDSTQT